MFTDAINVKERATDALSRRGVGKASWRRVIENLIFSEKEDMQDMATLRRLLANSPEGQKLVALMQERKVIRVIELNDLLHYKPPTTPREASTTPDGIPDWLK